MQKLIEYKQKRDFSKTSEPAEGGEINGRNIFVIQKHDATRLHYDFRLSIDGVLASWAVPKEPSLDPSVKRLAIQTEDHPLSYKDFEGQIPEGEYGAGKVIVWDRGEYQNLRSTPMKKCVEQGQIEIALHGKKLKGIFFLIKTKGFDNSKNAWLFMKKNDKWAKKPSDYPEGWNRSVISGIEI